ncbi:HAD-superfamily hydrolase, subfamily IA, variant 3 [Clostridium sp. DL-VIII]|uniref:HAD-IA family hydrolase n=1 Tax=Clostridium sp. DL-VIII TaxID=641107 RepID=UPI00023B0599|nr:HAD-IA family hydrolase [Clostridium sp. DL-VIII]EHJ00860.1 HAD-superfamily hydrolase, subfamily IA, variant 3 [Clostridium sp. DL-VIII]
MSSLAEYKNIKAILFDSGKVLNGPRSGKWFISPKFFEYINPQEYKEISSSDRNNAFEKAGKYIDEQKLITTEEEEYKHFLEFFNIFSMELPQLQLSSEKIQLLAKDLVFNYDKYEFYSDVFEVIPRLSKKYKLAVVSDAWPSLENVFRQVKLRDYFSSFVISSVKGVTKPHELMYKSALSELNVKSEEALFIDDNPKNCKGACKLGIKAILLNRNKLLLFKNKITSKNRYKVLSNLYELEKEIN